MLSRRHAVGQSLRRIMAMMGVFLIALLITGVPVTRPSRKDLSSPFPCMNSHCGCMTAEQCWRDCCCHTLQEKLAWAHEHGVTPPDYVLDQKEMLDVDHSCCASHKRESDSSSVSVARKDCCSHSSCCEQEENDEEKTPSFSWLVTIHALKCKGNDGWSLLTNSLVVSTDEEVFVTLQSLPSEDVAKFCCHFESNQASPEYPPPRQI